ncbi:MAG: hypothetical protein AAF928_04705 [Myxococcota bacterium]
MMRSPRRTCLAALTALGMSMGCNLVGEGEGRVASDRLYAIDCWDGAFELRPDFFAAVPFDDTMQIRIQRGNDLQEFSDGLVLTLDGVSSIRPRACTLDSDCATGTCGGDGLCLGPDRRGTPVRVGLPGQLAMELAPAEPREPAPVSLSLFLNFSCRNKNTTLYAIDGTITFDQLFSNDPNERSGSERLTEARFDVTVADPRDAPEGTLDVPADRRSRLTGDFSFVFQRGQPGQPFP